MGLACDCVILTPLGARRPNPISLYPLASPSAATASRRRQLQSQPLHSPPYALRSKARRHTTSSPCCRLKLVTLATRWFHSRSLFSTNALLNSTLSGVSLRPLQPALRISFVQNWKVLGIGILMASYQAKNLPRTWFGYHYAILNYPNSRCPSHP